MGIFRRARGNAAQTADALIERALGLIESDLGPEVLRGRSLSDVEVMAELEVTELLGELRATPPDRWPQAVHRFYEPRRSLLQRGAALEAATASFDAARPLLRLQWVAEDEAPHGLASRPGPLPGTRDRLTLHGPESERLVLRSRLARWGVGEDEAFAAAEANETASLRELSLETDGVRWAVRSPSGFGLSAALRNLGRLGPGLVGTFGSLVAVPAPGVLIGVALSADPLLTDAVQWVLGRFIGGADAAIGRPMLVGVDGSVRAVELTVERDRQPPRCNIDDPRLRGALSYLDPDRRLLEPASWAPGVDALTWTRFAGVVVALVILETTPSVGPRMVRHFGSTFSLRGLLRLLLGEEPGRWPALLDGVAAQVDAALRARAPARRLAAAEVLREGRWLDAVRLAAGVAPAPGSAVGLTLTEKSTLTWAVEGDRVRCRSERVLVPLVHVQHPELLRPAASEALSRHPLSLQACGEPCRGDPDIVWLDRGPEARRPN